jgi:23S rRNA pseudouridine1911/1915/1917 synthase
MTREVRLPLTATGRLDRALADALGLGRASVKRAFQLGEVRIDGRRVRPSDPVRPGALVAIDVEAPAGPPVAEPEMPLTVLWEGERCLVADKPAGVAVHALLPGEGGTLANAVAGRFPECAEAAPEPREGGAVHRLDVETSGCVLFARDPEAWDLLRAQFREQSVEKIYLALVAGKVSAGGVTTVPLAQRGGRVVPVPDEVTEERLRAKGTARPRPAETHWEVERPFARHTLLRVRIVTGVMHQIRAHLAHLGHPVVGDLLYGGEAAAAPGLERHFLHAWRLSFDPPGGGARVEVVSPLPRTLAGFLAALPEP